jgi:hypothetical protein
MKFQEGKVKIELCTSLQVLQSLLGNIAFRGLSSELTLANVYSGLEIWTGNSGILKSHASPSVRPSACFVYQITESFYCMSKCSYERNSLVTEALCYTPEGRGLENQ